MRILTEADLRSAMLTHGEKEYSVPADVFVTPMAKEYLKNRGIKLTQKNGPDSDYEKGRASSKSKQYIEAAEGRIISEKPEGMTHLYGNVLVSKTSPVIEFRGRLDSLQADIISAQVEAENENCLKLVDDLGEVLSYSRQILAAEVKNEPLGEMTLFGYSLSELRRVSHNIKTEFGLERHPIPEYGMGRLCSLINTLRTRARETELAATRAFGGEKSRREDIVTALNRMSSAFHIIFCRILSGYYD